MIINKIFTAFAVLCILSYNLFAQQVIDLQQVTTSTEILTNSSDKLTFSSSLGALTVDELPTRGGDFVRLSVPGYQHGSVPGLPNLPVMVKLIEVPKGANIAVQLLSYDEQLISLADNGIDKPIIPTQPPLSKSKQPDEVDFVVANSVYRDHEYYETQPVSVIPIGTARGISIAQIVVSPFSYDIASNTLLVKNNIVAEITFVANDNQQSQNDKQRLYSPAFEPLYRQLWNYKAPATKDALSRYPIKYQIVSDRMFESALQPFIDWKTKKGFIVNVAYTNDIGTSEMDIKDFLTQQWNAATTTDPAPTYLLLVGDVQQIPAHQCEIVMDGYPETHASDMYYCEFDGNDDYLPEMYYGRFSATTVAQLEPQIEKTLMYEQYTFPDPSFLNNVVLVAGDDPNNGPVHANGQVKYAADNYFNAAHNMNTTSYMYPESGDASEQIIDQLSHGVSFVNYTAHCSEEGWAGPMFVTSDIVSLENDDEYFFSIGNCCQSNTYDEDECFGEALLRAPNKGAVVHIGGSNSTYWDEDFYWSVGVTDNIGTNVTYSDSENGAYDNLFHEHDEDPYVTAGQIVYRGNMSVTESSTSAEMKEYYWQIYHVMGDPSLMPYAGVPSDLDYIFPPQVQAGSPSLNVTTEPQAYVALSQNGTLLDAQYVGQSGNIMLSFPPIMQLDNLDIVITRQFRKPVVEHINIVPNDNVHDVMLQTLIAPSDKVHYTQSEQSPKLRIMNMGSEPLTSAIVGYVLNDNPPVELSWTGNLAQFVADTVEFEPVTLSMGINTFVAYVRDPNAQADEFTANDTLVRNVKVYSGAANLVAIGAPDDVLCNENTVAPAVTIKNLDDFPLTAATLSYTCGNISESKEWTGNLAKNATADIVFSQQTFPDGFNTINFVITTVNGGENSFNASPKTADFSVVRNAQTVQVDFLTDWWPEENTWELYAQDDPQRLLYSGGNYPEGETHYLTDMCLAVGCYDFVVYDNGEDGLGYRDYDIYGDIILRNLTSGEQLWQLGPDPDSILDWDEKVVTFCLITTDVDEAAVTVNVFPNPSSGRLSILADKPVNKVEIYRTDGQLLLAIQNKHSDKIDIDMSNYTNGLYLAKVYFDNDIVQRKFLIIK